MKKLLLYSSLLAFLACSQPDAFDEVRILRRNYKLELDIAVNSFGEATYEIKAINQTGSSDLQDLTVFVRLIGEDEKTVLWQEKKELDLSGVKEYQTKDFSFKDQVPPEAVNYAYYDVILAPDDENSDFMKYPEFLRVAR
jgi:hypothetical protein